MFPESIQNRELKNRSREKPHESIVKQPIYSPDVNVLEKSVTSTDTDVFTVYILHDRRECNQQFRTEIAFV